MIKRISLREVRNLERLVELTEEEDHDVLVVERGEGEAALVVATDEKLIGLLDCFFTLNGLANLAGLEIVFKRERSDPGPG